MSGVAELIEQGVIEQGVPLGAMTTYKTGGPARYFAEVPDRKTLSRLIESGLTGTHPVLVLGRGSNVVVADTGFPGLVIRLGADFSHLEFEDLVAVAGAGLPLPRLARASAERGLVGLEFFVGIPGSVGGAVRQNAGCFGTETKDVLISAEVIDLHTGETARMGPTDLDLSYRHSNLAPDQLVLSARFRCTEGDSKVALEKIRVITRWRRDNQPGGTLNAGSVFKNPDHISAGALIDSLGLKGLSVGSVSVSEKHANFFVAGPGASAGDIYKLMKLVKDRVFELSGTILVPEVQFVGFEE